MGCSVCSQAAPGSADKTPAHVTKCDHEWGYQSLQDTVWRWRKSPSEYWKYFQGSELDAILSDGDIGLVRASWLVRTFDTGGRIEKRQSLPPEAFVSLSEIVSAGILEIPLKGGLRIIALSYGWLHPDHPDPQRAHLERVVHVLRAFIKADKDCGRSGEFGVVWDYMSLYQAPRSAEEEPKFRRALQALNVIYAHPMTRALMLTSMPAEWPAAYDLDETANAAQYFDRGWCFCEWSMATLVKNRRFALDLGVLDMAAAKDYNSIIELCTQGSARRAPLLPAEFTEALNQRAFTNRKDDGLLVNNLYERAYELELGRVKRLFLFGLNWGDDDAEQFAKVLRSGVFGCLQSVDLHFNQISDRGAALIQEAAKAHLRLGYVIVLEDNPCGAQYHVLH